jgi:hypothetical protein
MERLPFRVESRLAGILGLEEGHLQLLDSHGSAPALRCQWERPASDDASFVLRVHAGSGVPLASSPVKVARGESAFEARELAFVAMEGYSHLNPIERRQVEDRVWSRRAYATASAA